MISRGSRTPWGRADSVKQLGPQVYWVGTPSHGGLFIGQDAVAAIPETVRDMFMHGGNWAEEDCELSIALVILDAHGKIDRKLLGVPIEKIREAAVHTATTCEDYRPALPFLDESPRPQPTKREVRSTPRLDMATPGTPAAQNRRTAEGTHHQSH